MEPRPVDLNNGVFVDATFREGQSARIAVVRVIRGRAAGTHVRDLPNAVSSGSAEVEAVRWGYELYPFAVVYTDSTGAAARLGATWIPRGQNKRAHRAAARCISAAPKLKPEPTAAGEPELEAPKARRAKVRVRKQKGMRRWQGRGVIPPGSA